jgi:hypothetical protein
MAQLTIYLPDEVEARIRRDAKKAGQSLSAFIVSLTGPKGGRAGWPRGFDKLYGSWEGDFPEIDDPPPAERDPLE